MADLEPTRSQGGTVLRLLFGFILAVGTLCLLAVGIPGQGSTGDNLVLAGAGLALIGGTYLVNRLIHH